MAKAPLTFAAIVKLFELERPTPVPGGGGGVSVPCVCLPGRLELRPSAGGYTEARCHGGDCTPEDVANHIAIRALAFDAKITTEAVKASVKEWAAAPKGISAQALMAKEFKEPAWVVPGILPPGLTILGGKPKMGKSWLAMGLCVSVAAGSVALGNIQSGQAGVVYLALEDTERRLQDRLRIMLKVGDRYEAPPAGLEFFTGWPRLHDGGTEKLAAYLDEHPATKLVVIDTLQKVRQPSSTREGVYAGDYSALEPIKALADSREIAVLVIHHLKKMTEEDPLDQLSGSTGLSGGPDTLWILKRQRAQSDAELFITGRDVQEQELALSFDSRTCAWSNMGPAEEHRASAKQPTDKQQMVLNALEAAKGQPMFPKAIMEATGLTKDYVKTTLDRLHSQGKIHTPGAGQGWFSNNTVPPVPPVPPVYTVPPVPPECDSSPGPLGGGTRLESVPHAVPPEIALHDGVPSLEGTGGTGGTAIDEAAIIATDEGEGKGTTWR